MYLIVELMIIEYKDIFIINRVEIVVDLIVDDVFNFFRSKMVFDLDDVELIRVEKILRR